MIDHTDTLDVHYPTTVLERCHDGVDTLNQQLYELILDLADRYADTQHNAVRQGLVSTQGGYQTSTASNLLTLEAEPIQAFRDKLLMPLVEAYLRAVFGEEAATFSPWPVGWANLLDEGDWQGPHFHPTDKNVASGVYYVHLPDDKPSPQGCIEFLNPISQSVNHGFPATRRLKPLAGKAIMFPPWYIHYVHPFRGGGRRAIIAFDILAQKPGLDLVF